MALSKDQWKKEDLQEIRVILIGKTGAGKSYLGNVLLGRDEFHSSVVATSVTTSCAFGKQEITSRSRNYILKVIDTPGLKDNRIPEEETCAELVKCLSLSLPGPHFFIIVIQIGRFTEEELDAVKLLKREFGDQLMNFALVVFTHGSKLKGMPIEAFLETAPPGLQQVVKESHNRYAVICDDDKNLQNSVQNVIDLIVNSVELWYYTNKMFKKADEKKKEIIARLEEERNREIKALEEKVEELSRKENERCTEDEKKQIQEEKQRKEEDLKKTKTTSSEEIYDNQVISNNSFAKQTFSMALSTVACASTALGGFVTTGLGYLTATPGVARLGRNMMAIACDLSSKMAATVVRREGSAQSNQTEKQPNRKAR